MSEIIPADVMLTALEVTRVASIYPDAAVHISRAIMAERERCARIADDAVMGRSWQMSDANAHNDRRAARDFESMKFEAIEIAAAIRLSPISTPSIQVAE